ASKAATATTPIIFVIGADPVRVGLVASLNRPGGNITGVVFPLVPLVAKLLGMLHELVPKASMIAVLRDPNGPDVESEARDLEEAARAIGHQILMVNAANERGVHAAFAKVVQAGAGGLLIGSSPFFLSQRRQLVALAARHALPTMYNQREYAEVGGLISYGPSQSDAYAAAVEGAGFWRHHFQITAPLILPITLVALLFGIIFTFTDMIVVFVLTR